MGLEFAGRFAGCNKEGLVVLGPRLLNREGIGGRRTMGFFWCMYVVKVGPT